MVWVIRKGFYILWINQLRSSNLAPICSSPLRKNVSYLNFEVPFFHPTEKCDTLKSLQATKMFEMLIPTSYKTLHTLGSIVHPAKLTFSLAHVSLLVCNWRRAFLSCAPRGGSAKGGGVFWRKRSLVLFCSFRNHLRHKPGNTWFIVSGTLFRCYFKDELIGTITNN